VWDERGEEMHFKATILSNVTRKNSWNPSQDA